MAQDPQVPSQAWNGNQYSGTSEWRTRITPLRTAGTTYVPIAPFRVLSTPVGLGFSGKFKAGIPRTWQVTNGAEIPDEAVAVTGNVTVTSRPPPASSRSRSSETSSPPSSTINFPLGETRANNVTTPLSSTGSLSAVYKAKSGKTTDLVFDVTGYFLADTFGRDLQPLDRTRPAAQHP